LNWWQGVVSASAVPRQKEAHFVERTRGPASPQKSFPGMRDHFGRDQQGRLLHLDSLMSVQLRPWLAFEGRRAATASQRPEMVPATSTRMSSRPSASRGGDRSRGWSSGGLAVSRAVFGPGERVLHLARGQIGSEGACLRHLNHSTGLQLHSNTFGEPPHACLQQQIVRLPRLETSTGTVV
jgi:hypothetical protein